MSDMVLTRFLETQLREAMELRSNSDVLDLLPVVLQEGPPRQYIAVFRCATVVQPRPEQIEVAQAECHVGICFGPDHLRRLAPAQLITWLAPRAVFHPNIKVPFVCLGHLAPGIGLVDMLYQLYEVISFCNWAPHDALDPAAAQWARNHLTLFPTERRPLRRRAAASPSVSGGTP